VVKVLLIRWLFRINEQIEMLWAKIKKIAKKVGVMVNKPQRKRKAKGG
jgi:hypothetical protein